MEMEGEQTPEGWGVTAEDVLTSGRALDERRCHTRQRRPTGVREIRRETPVAAVAAAWNSSVPT